MKPPVAVEHDELGRVIAARFESTGKPVTGGEHWLIAVDGSMHALRAVEHAAKMAQHMEVALSLITVLPWQSREAAIELPTHASAQLEEACARLDAAGLPWRAHGVMGDPADCITSMAAVLGANAIVIGSHGRGAVLAMVMGSVALQVLHAAKVSVWVVRSRAT